MKSMVDIDVVLDERYVDPKITIQTREKTEQVENIINAIETVSKRDFPVIPAYRDDRLEFISQRDIIRICTSGRKIIVQTENGSYTVKKTLVGVEEMLNPERFYRISQSEIVNMYKVKCLDISTVGTIGIEFDDGTKSWVARSRVKSIKERFCR
ncbi:MAG: LytTR family transcriptional regulator [Lachnospiraceae bacterium]|nr:LytTR family transcriptional regulator [Lachnospiraceae bacterium]